MGLECYLTKGLKNTEILMWSNNPVFPWSLQIKMTCSLYLEFGPQTQYNSDRTMNSPFTTSSKPAPASNQSRLVSDSSSSSGVCIWAWVLWTGATSTSWNIPPTGMKHGQDRGLFSGLAKGWSEVMQEGRLLEPPSEDKRYTLNWIRKFFFSWLKLKWTYFTPWPS